MKDKMNLESHTRDPMAGVGVMSGFGMPKNPPDCNLDMDKKAIPKEDTHPGTGINFLTGTWGPSIWQHVRYAIAANCVDSIAARNAIK